MSGRAGFPGLPGDAERPMPLHPDELSGDAVSAQELGGALEAARSLEATAVAPPVRPSSDFADRVMARLEGEPTPGATGYLAPLRRLGLGGLVASVRQAWAVVGLASRPLGVRATALAYVLAVVLIGSSITGLAAFGTAGALGLLDGPDASPSPTLPVESPGPVVEPSPTTEPAPTAVPSLEPSEDPSATGSLEPEESDDDHGGASATPRETDDDHDSETPQPSKTPKPSQTPESTRTPGPSASADDD